jgi:hypothetical protein
MQSRLLIFLIVAFVVTQCSCRRERMLTSGGKLTFSTDTLKFDTVFTSKGSFTTGLLIYNPQSEAITLSSVRLRSGDSSFFSLNVNGFKGNFVTNLKVPPRDSIYVFATVNIDPTNELTPFVVADELIATLNGKDYSVPFTAYGQNAHFIERDSLIANTTWLTDKPYVVVGPCVVGKGVTLTIPANCRVYMHQDARFFVFGNLLINPAATQTSTDTVLIQGDRLDRSYFGYIGYPGEWGGVYVVTGGTCTMRNTILANCGGSTRYHKYSIQPAAVQVDTGGKLELERCIIRNSIGHGIFCFQGDVTATNSLFYNCGGQALAVVLGGRDSMTNCTFATYGSNILSHLDNPTVGIVNWLQISQTQFIYANLDVVLRNCIVWGSLDSELVYDTTGSSFAGITKTRLVFDHCLLKKGKVNTQMFAQFQSVVNKDPLFKTPRKGDFRIPMSSPAVGAGTVAYTPLYDLLGKPRVFKEPGYDVGCYQSAD